MLNLKQWIPEVFVLSGEPTGLEFDPTIAIRKKLADTITVEQARTNYYENYEALSLLKNLNDVTVIDPIDHLCNEGVCKTRDAVHGFYYRDNNHMRPWYSFKSNLYLAHIFENKQSKLVVFP